MHRKNVRLCLKMQWHLLTSAFPLLLQSEPETDELPAVITSDLIFIKYLQDTGKADPWQNTLGR